MLHQWLTKIKKEVFKENQWHFVNWPIDAYRSALLINCVLWNHKSVQVCIKKKCLHMWHNIYYYNICNICNICHIFCFQTENCHNFMWHTICVSNFHAFFNQNHQNIEFLSQFRATCKNLGTEHMQKSGKIPQ